MNGHKFQIGDSVRSKSGGSLMKVGELADGIVQCDWFDSEQRHHREWFLNDSLTLVKSLASVESAGKKPARRDGVRQV
jgi:uncharacterized protein YodC (DUF2158 family)